MDDIEASSGSRDIRSSRTILVTRPATRRPAFVRLAVWLASRRDAGPWRSPAGFRYRRRPDRSLRRASDGQGSPVRPARHSRCSFWSRRMIGSAQCRVVLRQKDRSTSGSARPALSVTFLRPHGTETTRLLLRELVEPERKPRRTQISPRDDSGFVEPAVSTAPRSGSGVAWERAAEGAGADCCCRANARTGFPHRVAVVPSSGARWALSAALTGRSLAGRRP